MPIVVTKKYEAKKAVSKDYFYPYPPLGGFLNTCKSISPPGGFRDL
jgi:hypothetical protein